MLINKVWYGPFTLKERLWQLVLYPFTVLFMLLSALRRFLFKSHLKKSLKLEVPVIIVGGITVGGAGKTPLSIALIEHLHQQGFNVGLISRGYKAKAPHYPFVVKTDSNPSESGDEPLLIKQEVGNKAVVVCDPLRARGARYLQHLGCNVILCDDGLQHYALNRSLEIIVLDSERLWGNGLCMPAGPLREGLWRLKTSNLVIVNGKKREGFENFTLKPLYPKNLKNGEDLREHEITALVGIANPERFYRTCESLGLEIVDKVELLDHDLIEEEALCALAKKRPVVMTSKDAVKYRHLNLDNLYVLEVKAQIAASFLERFDSELLVQKSKLSYRV